MLVKFTFKNYKSFFDEQVFSMEAKNDKEYEENVLSVSKELIPGNYGLLKTALVFGSNASGKSNLLRAIAYMQRCVLLSASLPAVRQNDTFAFLNGADEMDSHFEVEFIEGGTFYRYGFVINKKQVVKEWLFKRTERLTPVFKRERDSLSVIKMSRNSANYLLPDSTVLFVSSAVNLSLEITPQIRDVVKWFRRINFVPTLNRNCLSAYLEDKKYIAEALDVLKRAKTGIIDMEIIKDSNYIDAETTHTVYGADGEAAKVKKVRVFQDSGLLSEGTVRLICLLGLIFKALDKGEILLINDFSAFTTYQITNYFLNLINSPSANRSGAQLISTSHMNLLMDRRLRRDQIWFTSKDHTEKSALVSLASFGHVRKSGTYSKKFIEYTELPSLDIF